MTLISLLKRTRFALPYFVLAMYGPALLGDTVEFNRDIRPILSDKCFACHGPDKANRKTELRFDNEEGALVELKSGGLAIDRDEPAKSVLLQRITSDDPVLRMPPAYLGHDKLPDAEIEVIRRWIEQGSPWQQHWSFIPPERRDLPQASNTNWARNPIDNYVLRGLDQEGLKPSPEAGRRTLIRRISLDLTGLPPTPGEVRDFVNDSSTNAYEKIVGRLLESPRYGERMAIRWLDAARYADTNGYQSDGIRSMWRWRDWVIDAFNKNMPFDRFTIEQIAGDLLPNATRDQVIATAFNRNHRTTAEGGIVEEEFRVEYVADRVETTSTVWLGLTVGCARCHDHKYDPVLQKEFYQLFAYFNNVPERGLVYNFGNEQPFIKAPTPKHEAKLAKFDGRAARTQREFAGFDSQIARNQREWEKWLRKSETSDWTPAGGLILRFKLDGDLREDTGVYRERKSFNPFDEPDQVIRASVAGADDVELPFVDGKLGRAAAFDGEAFVDGGPGFKFNYKDPLTFSAWIYPTSPDGAILSKGQPFSNGAGHGLYLREGKLFLYITLRWTDISLRLQTEEPLPMNEWSHVTVTYNGKRYAKYVHIYIDGEEVAKDVLFDELTYPFSTDEPFRIGSGGGDPNFQGRIDDVRVYNRALSAEEASTVPLLKTIAQIAQIPDRKRTSAERSKLRLAFLDRAAGPEVRLARERRHDAQTERDLFYESIPTLMVMQESEKPRDAFLLKRGAYDAPGEKVEPGVPAILAPLKPDWEKNRLGLARWLVDRSNPLTARVTVNRFWQMLFSVGLVKTAENLGSQGEIPPNQDLLDWLAVEFMENGWDVKGILKTIVMSATYRQSSKVEPALVERDPDNRLFARGPRFRMSAEMIRDQALALSGLLVEQQGGPSVKPYQPEGLWKELSFSRAGYEADEGDGLYRRSLYTFWRRTIAPPSMITFDSTDRETCAVGETRTNTPLQALNLMNDVTYVEASRKMAERMMKDGGTTTQERIGYGFELATARRPQGDEGSVLHQTFQQFLDTYQTDPDEALELLSEGEFERDEELDPVELASYASVASLILNLDEAITKE